MKSGVFTVAFPTTWQHSPTCSLTSPLNLINVFNEPPDLKSYNRKWNAFSNFVHTIFTYYFRCLRRFRRLRNSTSFQIEITNWEGSFGRSVLLFTEVICPFTAFCRQNTSWRWKSFGLEHPPLLSSLHLTWHRITWNIFKRNCIICKRFLPNSFLV